MHKYLYLVVLTLIAVVLSAGKAKPVKVFMVGDSTMADKKPIADTPERGWGMVFPSFFDKDVVIENHAQNGRSTRTFIEEGLWDKVMSRLGEGDFVFIQFAHNDEIATKKAYTTEAEFEANYRRMVADVLAKKAHPILCSPVARRKFDSIGNPVDTHPVYAPIVHKVANELQVPFIDMHTKSLEILQRYGVEGSIKLYMHLEPGQWKAHPEGKTDDTHFVEAGAMEMAQLAAEGIKALRIKPLAKHLLKQKKMKVIYTIPTEREDNNATDK